jgi:NADH-quinone oxidoreductase subunit L
MKTAYLVVPFAPLVGAIIAGLFGKVVGRTGAHTVTIAGVLISCITAIMIWMDVQAGEHFNGALYTWITSGDLKLEVGFLIDSLTATMMVVVTFVSLLVHIYTIGYMHEDPGYQRFFSYISLFTFSMLMLVMSNNFLQLFFGWEAVGLVSYLLIGFWYTRPTAIYANLKAFLVNRVGDFGFLLGIALIFAHFGTLDYVKVFEMAPGMTTKVMAFGGWSLLTAICLLLFVGAMGKSAQFPLHVWLPDSMEGPTPISALIHAATMVTAGIFMVSRMSPLFELSTTALSVVLVIGAITALFMGLVAIVQNDIKRVVAYSTLSQLGYMTVALGASAYAAGMFHLVTHAFFKALLFLGCGSVIMGMHHEQDMRKMGGLKKYMPITYVTMFIGALASAGVPGFAGFFSKDAIIEAVHFSNTPGAAFAHFCVLACVFVTALYTFRLIFMVFHGKANFATHEGAHAGHGHTEHAGDHDDAHHGHGGGTPHESPAVVTLPLILLAIPSVCAGWVIGSVLFGKYFDGAIFVAPEHDVLGRMAEHFHGVVAMMTHALGTAPFWLSIAGIATAVYCYLINPALPVAIKRNFGWLHTILDRKYWFDEAYSLVFAGGARAFGKFFWKVGDVAIIDGLFVNGAARLVGWFSGVIRHVQSGFIYHYAFTMIIGVLLFLSLWFMRA